MNRQTFMKSMLATATFSVFNPFGVLDLFTPVKDIVLPFIDEEKKITLLKRSKGLVEEANSQNYQTQYGYHSNYNYNTLAPYQEWYAYQQAIAQWNYYYQQQQQYYAWLQQAHLQQMQYLMQQYNGYQIGVPAVRPAIQSIYAFAKMIVILNLYYLD